MEKKTRKKTRKIIVQDHHVSYDPEVKVRVYKGEHMILTRLSWRKKISMGFIKALEVWINEKRLEAVELSRKV
jgi:hypothetical protein